MRIKVVDSPFALAFGEKGYVKRKGKPLEKWSREKWTGKVYRGWNKKKCLSCPVARKALQK